MSRTAAFLWFLDMPIKFACEHCQKRLVVGTRKAGTQADCPSCGKPIRVPEPPPAGAAGLGGDGASSAWPPTIAPAGQGLHRFEEFIVYDDDEELASDPAAEPAPPPPSRHVVVPRTVIYIQGVLLAVVAVVSFLLGMLAGGAGDRAQQQAASPTPFTMRGRVEYLSASGRLRPDEGAVVVLLPQNARPEAGAKWPVAGLRPGDPPPDENDHTLRAIQELGGDYARTDMDGRYHVDGADTGEYFLLVISRRGIRSDNDPPKRSDVAQIGRYFTPTLDLLQSNEYQWLTMRINGDESRDVIFQ